MPGWLVISINTDPLVHEALSAFLFDIGCEGIVLEDFNDHILKAYLPFTKEFEALQERIHHFIHQLLDIFPEIAPPPIHYQKIANQDWDTQWRQFFRPLKVTDDLMVIPAWETFPDHSHERVIRIDPGPAFGTGQHPTTRMCLEAMGGICLPKSWEMLDVGTGSGILSIYGAQLGAERVVDIDIDPEALRWAKKNIALNPLPVAIDLSDTSIENITGRFEILTANLFLGTIVTCLPHFSRLLRSDGRGILSGILQDQMDSVEKSLKRYPLSLETTLHMEEWVCLVVKKSNTSIIRGETTGVRLSPESGRRIPKDIEL